MTSTPIIPVILCGGSGTRLWPRSRKARPKPFLPLTGAQTLFQASLSRCTGPAFAPPLVVAGADHAAAIEAQAQGVDGLGLIVEPAGRNTAPAIALAALRQPPEAIMLICPSDHHIADPAAFLSAALAAARLAVDDWLVSFGIAPSAPETGYGYLKRGAPIGEFGFAVEQFVEKPDAERARAFVADGGYSWNGGIFAFRAGAFLGELRKHRPVMFAAAEAAVAHGRCVGPHFHPQPAAFAAIEAESVDYAVMENTARAAMVPVAMGWSDVGNWDALHGVLPRDGSGNTLRGRGELLECRNVLVESDGPRVSVIGLEDVIIVVDGGEVLVTSRAGAQQVGKLRGASEQ